MDRLYFYAATTFLPRKGLIGFLTHSKRDVKRFLLVAVPCSPTAVNVFASARVVHSSRVPSKELYRLGIMYLAENDSSS